MAENLAIATSTKKEERYEILLPQIESLVTGESDLIANLSNIAAALKQTFNFFWVGFYLVKGNELVLGPFQGPIACTRIGLGKEYAVLVGKRRKLLSFPMSMSSPATSRVVQILSRRLFCQHLKMTPCF